MTIGRGTLTILAGVLVALLGVIGYLLPPPAFDPPPLEPPAAFRDLPAQPASETRPPATVYPVTTETITVPVRGDNLVTTIRTPQGPGPFPAMVFVQGSGSGDRGEFSSQAEWLAQHGIVTLAYDKRTHGYSFRSRDFALLADDAVTMIDLLRQRPSTDPARTGLWGVSEGGWVVPIAASRSSAIAYTVLVSSPNVSPMRQVAWALNEQLLRLHAPTGVRDLLTRAMGGVGFDFLRYDSAPALHGMRQPTLALYGTGDPSIPFVESTQTLIDAKPADNYTIRFLAGADHAMRQHGGPFVPDYLPTLSNWITGLPHESPVKIAGAKPIQRYEATDVPAAPWYGASSFLGLTLTLAAFGYVAAPVTEMFIRLRGRDLRHQTNTHVWPPIRRRLWRMIWTSLALLASVLAFIMLIVLFSVNQAGAWPAVQAGWLVVRVLAVVMLAQVVGATGAVLVGLRDGWEMSRSQQVSLTGVLGGTALMLVTAAYYGLFGFPW
ncbi:alpha/beta hydrolase [Herbidospora sp. NBRC 101105]|uniref:alpha/beta hydrolase family protein n=1 Tax=Herbidospora sp. NBRC 101105 TaxID=3032195 RepID=UPI0025571FDD|nr:alpha/beta hydrolase [Herbidospora sp. NBRC 101105]